MSAIRVHVHHRLLFGLLGLGFIRMNCDEVRKLLIYDRFVSSFLFDVRKSVHHHTIQINQPTRCNIFTSLLLDVYVWLNMFRAPLRPSSGAYNCTRSLWFYRWSVAVGALLVVVWQVCQTTTNNAPTVKPEAPSAVVRSGRSARPRPITLQPPRSNGETRGS